MFTKFFKRREVQRPFQVRIGSSGIAFNVPPGITVLEAALDAGIGLAHDCRVGTCGTCRSRLLEGDVNELSDKALTLSADELRENYILICQSIPRSDLLIEPAIPMRESDRVIAVAGTVNGLKPLTHDILELELMLDRAISYQAGQYLDIEVPMAAADAPAARRSYSFASAATSGPTSVVRFHVRRIPGGMFTDWLHREARPGDRLRAWGPYGSFTLRESKAPIIAVAGGSGTAPIKAILEQALFEGVERDVYYFFGARRQADLYALDEIEAIGSRWHGRFEFVTVLSDESEASEWQGPRGFVTDYVGSSADLPFGESEAYLCGPPPMVDAAIKLFLERGMDPNRIFFDKFLDRSYRA
jgi:NAD(P)H-flavin reductase/ferredoxin